ncbi:hypothetical protein C5942_09235 [Cronobacter sakazakii]|nr:hypothetical protein C5942_09235 [Cronobacter sakazakii]
MSHTIALIKGYNRFTIQINKLFIEAFVSQHFFKPGRVFEGINKSMKIFYSRVLTFNFNITFNYQFANLD